MRPLDVFNMTSIDYGQMHKRMDDRTGAMINLKTQVERFGLMDSTSEHENKVGFARAVYLTPHIEKLESWIISLFITTIS